MQIVQSRTGKVLWEDVTKVNLDRVNLYGAYLRGAHLPGSYMGGADLRRADLRRADLRRADLCRADLCRADLHAADLRNANLREADLRGADLRMADLRMADLRGVDLRMADLRGADLGNQWIVEGGTRSDGYEFKLTNFTGEGVRVKAGCRDFTIPEAVAHWERTRKGTPLGYETAELVNGVVALAYYRGLIDEHCNAVVPA